MSGSKEQTWYGRCKRHRTTFVWPAEGNLLRNDLAQEPKCLYCKKPLRRTIGNDDEWVRVSRASVGLK